MIDFLERENMLIHEENIDKIGRKKILLFGVGGVGGACAEALSRAGISFLDIVDNDTIDITNINRQIIALHSNVGQKKTEVLKKRLLDINPNMSIKTYPFFYVKETYGQIDLESYDYIIDCIDTISSKIYIAQFCFEHQINLISCMGTGNRLDPTQFELCDLYETSLDPVAKVMRSELRKRNVKKLNVLCSKEPPIGVQCEYRKEKINGRITPGSISFVPPVAGMIIASKVIKDLIRGE